MAWFEGPKEYDPKEDINDQLLAIDHFKDDEEARLWACKFLEHNLAFAAKMIMNVDLFEFQAVMLRMMFNRDDSLHIVSRGGAKTWLGAVFAGLFCVFNPGSTIIIVSMSFRQAKKMLEYFITMSSEPDAVFIRQCMKGTAKRYTSYWQQDFQNGSKIIALPLGGGSMLRGERADKVICDELLGINEKILTEVIGPFLATNTKQTYMRTQIVKSETKLIKSGKMKEKERTKFPTNGFIGLSSATFQFEYLYDLFKHYNGEIKKGTSKKSYGVCQLSHEVMPEGYFDEGQIEKEKAIMSDIQFKKEYGAQFVDESGGFFNIKKLREGLSDPGHEPFFEIEGNAKDSYILSIDPAYAEGSDIHDDFAMAIYKIVDKERRKMLLVHSYARSGRPLSEHYKYFLYLLQAFNVSYLIIDDTGGQGNSFIKNFKLTDMFNKYDKPLETFNENEKVGNRFEMIKNIKDEYSPEAGRIVHLQNFTAWSSIANYELQQSVDRKRLLFPSMPTDKELEKMADRAEELELHKLPFWRVKDEYSQTAMDFIENQSILVHLTIDQTAFIEPRNTGAGQRFDLPQWLLKDKSPKRTRKDCYSALLMANWAAGCLFDMMAQEDEFQTVAPSFIEF